MSTGRLGINTHLSVPDSWLCSTPANVIFLAEWRCPRSCQSFRQLSWYSSVQHHRRAWLEKKQQFVWKVWMLTSNPRGGENKTVQEIVRSKGYKLGTWKFPGSQNFIQDLFLGRNGGEHFGYLGRKRGILSPLWWDKKSIARVTRVTFSWARYLPGRSAFCFHLTHRWKLT